jgi:polyhydroxybutyrate depolymerase
MQMHRKHVFCPATVDALEERVVMSTGNLSHVEPAPTIALRAAEQRQRLEGSDQATALVAGDQMYYMRFGGLTRSYLVHVPFGYDGTSPLPVVLAFHGGGGNAQLMEKQTGLDQVSDEKRFLVVYPNGTGPTKHKYWDAGIKDVYAATHHVNDVGFVNAILNALPRNYNIDARRVYATGFSNGAFLTYLLAEDLSNRITAFAPVSGGQYVTNPPSRPVPLVDFQGLLDPYSLFFGGKGPILGVQEPSIPKMIVEWAQVDDDNPTPASVSEGPGYVLYQYERASPAAHAPVELYVLPRGGHTWPGGVNLTAGLGTGPLIRSVDASAIIWDFFQRFTL